VLVDNVEQPAASLFVKKYILKNRNIYFQDPYREARKKVAGTPQRTSATGDNKLPELT
jgi:hypothetical protein